MTDQGITDALMWGIAIGGFGLVILCLAWIAENIDRISRWLDELNARDDNK